MKSAALLWLVGINLRLAVLALPPVLPMVHRDLGLDETGVAALAGLPLVLFAAGGVPGAWLIARFGVRRVVVMGLLATGIASAMRGLGPSVATLFGATIVMGAGIAICQPAGPALVRQWFPGTIGRGASLWSNGLLVGTLLSSSLTLLLLLPLIGSWEASFVVWGLPALVVAGLFLIATPSSTNAMKSNVRVWWPNWREPQLWQLGLIQSAGTLVFFGASTFIPDFLHASNRPEQIGPTLTALGLGQLPGSVLVGALPLRRLVRTSAVATLSATTLVGLGLLLVAPGSLFVGAAFVLGGCAGVMMSISLALPAMLVAPTQVARVSGGVLALGYLTVSMVLFATGRAWDATHVASVALAPGALGGILILLLADSRLLVRVSGHAVQSAASQAYSASSTPGASITAARRFSES